MRDEFKIPSRYRYWKENGTNLTLHTRGGWLINDSWAISCVGSANFTNNPRIEAGHISTARNVAEFHADWSRAEIANAAPFGVDMRKAGKRDGRS